MTVRISTLVTRSAAMAHQAAKTVTDDEGRVGGKNFSTLPSSLQATLVEEIARSGGPIEAPRLVAAQAEKVKRAATAADQDHDGVLNDAERGTLGDDFQSLRTGRRPPRGLGDLNPEERVGVVYAPRQTVVTDEQRRVDGFTRDDLEPEQRALLTQATLVARSRYQDFAAKVGLPTELNNEVLMAHYQIEPVKGTFDPNEGVNAVFVGATYFGPWGRTKANAADLEHMLLREMIRVGGLNRHYFHPPNPLAYGNRGDETHMSGLSVQWGKEPEGYQFSKRMSLNEGLTEFLALLAGGRVAKDQRAGLSELHDVSSFVTVYERLPADLQEKFVTALVQGYTTGSTQPILEFFDSDPINAYVTSDLLVNFEEGWGKLVVSAFDFSESRERRRNPAPAEPK